MAAKKKRVAKKKTGNTLGSGIAGKGEKLIKGRKAQLQRQECQAMGGTWRGGKCR